MGVVEVVTNCSTLAGIVKEAEKSALGVFDKVCRVPVCPLCPGAARIWLPLDH